MEVSHLALLSRRSLSALVTCSLVGSLTCAPVGVAYASDDDAASDQAPAAVAGSNNADAPLAADGGAEQGAGESQAPEGDQGAEGQVPNGSQGGSLEEAGESADQQKTETGQMDAANSGLVAMGSSEGSQTGEGSQKTENGAKKDGEKNEKDKEKNEKDKEKNEKEDKEKLAAQSIEAGKANQPIETAEGTWYVKASADKTLTITGFKQAGGATDSLTIPNSFKVGDDTFNVSTVALASGANTSFSASQVVISAGLSVTNLAALKKAGTSSLVLGDNVYYSAATFRAMSKASPNRLLSSLSIGNGVVFANSGAFQFNVNLSSLSIGSGVTLQSSQFQGCTALSSVNLNGNATTSSLFNGCTRLSQVSGVSGAIADSSFESCSGLTGFDFSVVSGSIGNHAFSGCTKMDIGELVLTDVTVGPSAFANVPVKRLRMTGGSIDSSAFSNCKSLESVVADVSSIGSQAFGSCGSITSLTLGCQISSIDGVAFKGAFPASGDVSIAFDDSQNERYHWNAEHTAILDDYDLQVCPYCEDDANVSRVRKIDGLVSNSSGANAWRNNFDKSTLKLTVAKCVETIKRSIFAGDQLINLFEVADGNRHFKVIDGALYSADGMHLVKAPATAVEFNVPEGVLYIDEAAFANCVILEKVELPSTILEIGPQAFFNCVELSSIELPDTVHKIESLTFSGCSKLASVKLPSMLREIESRAFLNCTSLSSIDLPDGVESIGTRAFAGTSLTTFKANESLWTNAQLSSFVQDSVNGWVNWLFVNGLENGQPFTPADTASWLKGLPFYRTLITLDLSAYQASFIPYYAFAGLPGITEVQIPSNVTHIGSGAFYFCDNLSTVYCYAPDSMTIDMYGAGQGNSGSGNPNETFAIEAPGAFSRSNNELEASSSGEGSTFEDRTGLTFYGCAYNKELQTWCGNYGQSFIPIVALQSLAGSSNPFWNKTLSSQYAVDYGRDMTDYGYVQIEDIAKGGTPKVIAKFGQYDGTRDLTDDAACSIVYYGPDGTKASSFDEEGEYTAALVGDGKSVFGARQIKFYVGERPQEQEKPVEGDKPSEEAKPAEEVRPAEETKPAEEVKPAEETKPTGNAANARIVAAPANAVTYQTVYTSGAAAAQAVATSSSNVLTADDSEGIAMALERIAGSDSTILVWGGGTEAAPQYVWEVPGGSITAENAAGLDFKVEDSSKNAKFAGLAGDADYAAFSVDQKGSFPSAFALHWKTSSTFYDGAKVNVYRVVDPAGASPSLQLLESGVSVVDGYVTVGVDRGGTYMLVESIEDPATPLVEKAYADDGQGAATEGSSEQQPAGWMLPTALAAVAAAGAGAVGGWLIRLRRLGTSSGGSTNARKR